MIQASARLTSPFFTCLSSLSLSLACLQPTQSMFIFPLLFHLDKRVRTTKKRPGRDSFLSFRVCLSTLDRLKSGENQRSSLSLVLADRRHRCAQACRTRPRRTTRHRFVRSRPCPLLCTSQLQYDALPAAQRRDSASIRRAHRRRRRR